MQNEKCMYLNSTASTSRINSSGRRCAEADLLPPSPEACETPARHASEWLPSRIHSSTGDRSRWHRRKERTCLRIVCLDTHHTAGRPVHMASLPPETKQLPRLVELTSTECLQ